MPGLKFSPHFHSRSRKASAHGAERAGSEGSCAREKERKSLRSFDVILLFKLLGKRKDSALPCWVFSVGKIMKEWREIRYGLFFWPARRRSPVRAIRSASRIGPLLKRQLFIHAGLLPWIHERVFRCGSKLRIRRAPSPSTVQFLIDRVAYLLLILGAKCHVCDLVVLVILALALRPG